MKTVMLFALLLFTITLISCNHSNKSIVNEQIDTVNEINSDTITVNNNTDESVKPLVGKRIYGDFDGNGSFEYAYMELTKEAEGDHPLDGGTPAEYTIKFTDKNIPVFPAGCCEMTLINEGDLNSDGSDEISIFQAPINGCEGVLPKEELQDIITLENGVIYRRVVDINDETGFYHYIEDENGTRFDFTKLKKEKANIILDSKQ